jgi:hypothetical protein
LLASGASVRKNRCARMLSQRVAQPGGNSPMRACRAVTLTEMLAVTAGAGCLVALLLTALTGAKDAADRAACAANLGHLGQALLLYACEHDGFLPDCGAASPLGGMPPADGRHFAGRWDAPGSAVRAGRKVVGNQANLWILVYEGYAAPRLFVCPATADRPSLNSPQDRTVMGFLALDPGTGKPTAAEDAFLRRVAAGRCSYSYQNQFAHPLTDAAVADPRNATTHTLLHPATLAIAADRNPYTRTELVRQPVVSPADQPEANSLNHHGAGQNVLYLGGEVEWWDTPCCGILRPAVVKHDVAPAAEPKRDNIYRPDDGDPCDPQNVPRSVNDSYLVP